MLGAPAESFLGVGLIHLLQVIFYSWSGFVSASNASFPPLCQVTEAQKERKETKGTERGMPVRTIYRGHWNLWQLASEQPHMFEGPESGAMGQVSRVRGTPFLFQGSAGSARES